MNRAAAFSPCGYWLFALAILAAGCGRAPENPFEVAQKHFVHGRFDAAIEEAQGALKQSAPEDEQSRLWALLGRCYWEKSGLEGDPAAAQGLLDQSLDALGKSIAIMDNSEARIVRSLVYEKLGRQDLSDEDDRVFRELDPEVRKSYINSPAMTRYDLPTREETPESSAGEEPSVLSSGDADKPRDSGGAIRDVLGSDEAVAAPASPPEPPRADERPSTPSENRSQPKPKPRYRGLPKLVDEPKRRTRGTGPGQATSGESTRTESTSVEDESEEEGEPQETEGEAEEWNEETEGKPRPSTDEGEVAPAYPQLPGSTWQTLEPPSGDPSAIPGAPGSSLGPYGGPIQGAPPTGITGPNLNPSPAPADTGFGPAPTGIVGPRLDPAPMPPTASPYSTPPTGIVGPPASQLPGSQLIPGGAGIGRGLPFTAPNPAAGLRVPYTGALPPNMRPAEGPAGSMFSQGPAYSPLRPSPLTNPQLAQPRVPTGGFPAVPPQAPVKRPVPPATVPRSPLPTTKPLTPPMPR